MRLTEACQDPSYWLSSGKEARSSAAKKGRRGRGGDVAGLRNNKKVDTFLWLLLFRAKQRTGASQTFAERKQCVRSRALACTEGITPGAC